LGRGGDTRERKKSAPEGKGEVDYATVVPVPPKASLSPPLPKPLHYLLFTVRFIGVWAYLLTTIWFLWLLVPLMPLHPLLRKLGVPNQYLPMDLGCRIWGRLLLFVAGLWVEVEGSLESPTVLVPNHLSAIDGFVHGCYTPGCTPRFILKKTMIYYCPPVFGLAYVAGHYFIDRSNRQQAIASMTKAAVCAREAKRTVCVYAEGTRSRTGTLQPFKKGAFHLAKDAEVPITPCVLTGCYDLWKPGQVFTAPGVVKIKFLNPIPTKGKAVEELLVATRKAMVVAIESEKFKPKDYGHLIGNLPAIGYLALLFALYSYW